MARLRTFIAIELAKANRDRLVALQNTLAKSVAGVKWVEPENLHLTLLFLGEVDERELPALCGTVETVTQSLPAFSLTVAGAGCFPNPRRPHVFWAGITDGAGEVCALHDALEPPLLELGCYRREDRKYTPHVTLGRLKSNQAPAGLAVAMAKLETWQAGAALVREVHVMSSQLTPQGPTYTVLSRAKMG
ncbi:MAG: RNA 2',3'-cyclic phosphodiesterase [Gemmataceae bacterium]|nr:RNA 2',3'-cyclic phosphodiesterase [Gemmataceae bacterium]